MKKFTDTFWGKVAVTVTGALTLLIIIPLLTVIITAWNQPEINDELKLQIEKGDTAVIKYVDKRMKDNQENIMSGIQSIKEIIDALKDEAERLNKRIDRHIDKDK